MKKFVSALLVGGMLLSASLLLVACEHEHTFKDEWSSDETHHWRFCEVKDCTEREDEAEHTWDGGTLTSRGSGETPNVMTYACTVCGASRTEEVPVDTTMTEETWKTAIKRENFTVEGYYITKQNVKRNWKVCKAEKTAYYEFEDDYETCIKSGGTWYTFRLIIDDRREIRIPANVGKAVETMLLEMPEYDAFEYKPDTKSYEYVKSSDENDYYKLNLYFEDGYLVKAEASTEKDRVTRVFTFSLYGETKVELPSYS